jgi:aldehyde dehydrogenase (NAD+)
LTQSSNQKIHSFTGIKQGKMLTDLTKQNLIDQRTFFNANQTKDIRFRIMQLKKLKAVVLANEKRICEALHNDLRKSTEEAYLTEIGIVLNEIDYHIKHLKKWVAKRVSSPLVLFPSSSKIIYEPLGVVLIIAPWNYPFQLLINPLIGVISAGCCAVLKPSPDAPSIEKVVIDLINDTFEPNYIQAVSGGIDVNQALLKERFDFIFFTGSPRVGKIVLQAAAEHLTPVILELGGKSPCIVDADSTLSIAAKRIIWGKFINAGQTCIAPDYIFVHHSVKEELISKLIEAISNFFGNNPQESPFLGRIIHERAFDRLIGHLQQGNIRHGGITNKTDKYISPTLIDDIAPDCSIMQEEIFGPLLPIMTFDSIQEPIDYIKKNEKPLALYFFGKQNTDKVLSETSSGGVCINDTLMHVVNHNLPFGGVGNSGIGKYHGKESFLVFSNAKGVVKTSTWIDLPLKYVPYNYFKWIKKLM